MSQGDVNGRGETFAEWRQNLHDVFMTAQLMRLLRDHGPRSPMDETLEALRASRPMRLQRCFVRDLWVLWEAWSSKPEFIEQFRKSSPLQVARIEEVADQGRGSGTLDLMRSVRDYMCHRDKREYWDAGRADVEPSDAAWFEMLQQAFSELFLDAVGEPVRSVVEEQVKRMLHQGQVLDSDPDVGVDRDVTLTTKAGDAAVVDRAIAAVDDVLMGFVTTMLLTNGLDLDRQESLAEGAGYATRAFVSSLTSNSELWAACSAALVRRAVLALHEIDELDQAVGGSLSEAVVAQLPSDQADVFACLGAGIVETAADSARGRVTEWSTSESSRSAMHRFVAWLNESGDTMAAVTALIGLTGRLYLLIALASEEQAQVTVARLGTAADEF